MRYFSWGFLVLVAGASLGGCTSSNFRDAAFDASASQVHTIGLLSISAPPRFSVVHATTSGEFFEGVATGVLAGPGGPAIAESSQQGKLLSMGAVFTRAVDAYDYQIETNLTDALARDLRSEGYNVVIVNVSRSSNAFMASYPRRAGIDAYLDVYFTKGRVGYIGCAGYLKRFRSRNYYPYMHIAARLVDAGNGKVLYAKQTIYNPWQLPIGVNLVKPDQHYGFSNYRDLMTHVKRAIEGFQVAVGQVARITARDIR